MNDIRELVATTLNELGFGEAKSLGERLVCCERYYVGVRFDFEGVSAIWLSDIRQIRFIDASEKLLKVVRFNPGQDVVRKAA